MKYTEEEYKAFGLPDSPAEVPAPPAIQPPVRTAEKPSGGGGFITDGLPYDIFSQKWKDFADYVANQYSCSRDYVVATMVMVAGVAIGRKATIRYNNYSNHAGMFIALVGNSGMNKSKPSKVVLRPLFAIDNELMSKFLQQKDKIKEANDKARKANRRKENYDNQQPMLAMPKEKGIILNDCTPEKRNEMLANIQGDKYSLLTYFDELPGLFKQFGRYHDSSEIEDLLSLNDGGSYVKISRKSQDTIIVSDPCLSIFGTIQESVMRFNFADKNMLHNGFNQRWLFVLPSYMPIPMETGEDNHDQSKEMEWGMFVNELFKKDFGKEEDRIYVTGKAGQLYTEWKNAGNAKRNEMVKKETTQDLVDEMEYKSSVIAKLQIHCLRWLLACHYLSNHAGKIQICEEEMKAAIRAMDYFYDTAVQVFTILRNQEGSNEQKTYQRFTVVH